MKSYITTPIYYVNAKPHLGHAYTTIVNDVVNRFYKLFGYDAYFLTGTDEHGDKIVQAAEKAGQTPKEYVDHISGLFKQTWPKLHIQNDDFIRTTEPRHIEAVKRFLNIVHDKGDIYFGSYGGHYCFGCERFYTEKELVNGQCPDHQTTPQFIEEENYFFKMGKYQQWLIDHIKANPDFIRPERYKNEVLGFLREPLDDLCISRPKTRLTWGIELPFDDRFVTYVWFDALINYLSALGWPNGELYNQYWPVAQHTIAKDILKPHAIFWPTMLKSAGIEVYQHLNVHGYWQIGASKMSKSVGNVVEALSMADVYGVEPFRYFLLRDMVFGLDSEFYEESMVSRLNADLANDLGNLIQRSISMVEKFSCGRIPPAKQARQEPGSLTLAAQTAINDYLVGFKNFAPHKALNAVWDLISKANKFIDSEAPWALAKDDSKKEHLEGVLYQLVETMAVTGALVWPVMPETSEEIWDRLALGKMTANFSLAAIQESLKPGLDLKPGSALFPRIEIGGQAALTKAQAQKPAKEEPKKSAEAQDKPKKADIPPVEQITFDEFKRLDLRVAEVKAAEAVPKSNKLLKLQVAVGEEERQIVAGIGQHFTPEEMVGKKVVIVANLAPAKLMGLTSQGMVLAVSSPEGLALLTPNKDIPSGGRVS